MSKVISQSTSERLLELEEKYLELKPYFEKGYTLSKAVQECYNLKPIGFYNSAWYKDLKKYCKNKGVNVLGNY